MPQTWVRRIRGIAVSMALWAIPWSIVGFVIGLVLKRGGEFLASPAQLAGVGAIVGLMNGFSFAVLLAVAERNRSIETLRAWRMGVWGAVTTGAVGWLVFRDWNLMAICAAAGFGTSALSLWIARRAVSGGAGGAGSDASFGG
jgi:hypothetical protein